MDGAEETLQRYPYIERVAMQSARNKANVARWGLNVAILLFAILTTIIILISQGVGINVVAPLAICGLAAVWIIGWRRGDQLYKRFYAEELSNMRQKASKEDTAVALRLTSREIEILNYIAQGYSNKQVAALLDISEGTIKNHVTTILTKLNANDRTDAVVIAIKHGLISVE